MRDRGSVLVPLDFRRMDFPGKLNDCETCHVTSTTSDQKTYNFVPQNTLMSTYESVDAAYAAGIAGGGATTVMARAARRAANATDIVTTPFAASCVSCHDSTPTKSHIMINGGVVNAARSSVLGVESCAVCHGPGRSYDTAEVHK